MMNINIVSIQQFGHLPQSFSTLKFFFKFFYDSEIFASASGDNTCKIWNVNEISSIQTIKAHQYEILTCDWNKYNENILVTGSVDKTIKIWDIRNTKQATTTMKGHTYAVRRLKCSPHDENIIASCS